MGTLKLQGSVSLARLVVFGVLERDAGTAAVGVAQSSCDVRFALEESEARRVMQVIARWRRQASRSESRVWFRGRSISGAQHYGWPHGVYSRSDTGSGRMAASWCRSRCGHTVPAGRYEDV